MTKTGKLSVKELQDYIERNIREVSQKTGKLIKVNTYKWNRAKLLVFIDSFNPKRFKMINDEIIVLDFVELIQARKQLGLD